MRALTIDARDAQSALSLAAALKEFRPELSGSDKVGYRVTFELGSSDREVVALLDALHQYVTESSSHPAAEERPRHALHVHAQ
jgi:hypothetical protein